MTSALLDPTAPADAIDDEILNARAERLNEAGEAGYVEREHLGLPPDADTDDPSAPYGRHPETGKPYKISAAKRAQLIANRHKGSSGIRPPGKTSGPKKGSAASVRRGPDYRPALRGLLALPTMALGVLATRNQAFALDAVTLHLYQTPLVDAVQDAAEQDERLAAVLERLNTVGPYGALVGVAVTMATQFAANHGRIPAGEKFGTRTAEELLVEAEKQAA